MSEFEPEQSPPLPPVVVVDDDQTAVTPRRGRWRKSARRWELGPSAEPSLLFLHVRKTGGTALARAISNRFAARDCLTLAHSPARSENRLDDYRYVAGHLDISSLEHFSTRPFVTTCLREPVERALSAYSYFRWTPPQLFGVLRDDLGPEAWPSREAAIRLAQECSPDELVRRAPELAREHFGNVQARVLCGLPGSSDGERLEPALAGLAQCDFVGLTERLDESATLLAGALGWDELGPLPRENVTPDRVRRDQLEPETLEVLSRLTAVDAELYAAAVDRFESQPAQRAATVGDAALVSDLSFAEPIRGAGWCGREEIGGDDWICWLGSTKRAWVTLVAPASPSRLVVEGPFALDPAIFSGLRLIIDGRPHPHVLEQVAGGFRVTSRDGLEAAEGAVVTVGLEVDRALRPHELNPSSPDLRELAVAVRRIALVPVGRPARSSGLLGRVRAAGARRARRAEAGRPG